MGTPLWPRGLGSLVKPEAVKLPKPERVFTSQTKVIIRSQAASAVSPGLKPKSKCSPAALGACVGEKEGRAFLLFHFLGIIELKCWWFNMWAHYRGVVIIAIR